MDESVESLEQALQLYANQLHQINEAIANDSFNVELLSLRSNITELIALTEQSLESVKSQNINADDPFTREYELFKAELESGSSAENAIKETDDNIEDELDDLIGSKCRAPFTEQWANTSAATYHNALIMSVNSEEALDSIRVKVIFVNPTCREMVPCQYYLDGKCKFADDQCHFSHGYVVHFSDLKEYKEPDFSLLKEDVTVLAKDEDDLWKRATITAMLPESNQCAVKFELGNKVETIVDTHHTLPLVVENEEIRAGDCAMPECEKAAPPFAGDVDDYNSEEPSTTEMTTEKKGPSSSTTTTTLGEWEKYTNGIGSKLMASMGYIFGTGLGKRGDGRVEPIDAVVLPAGKSLDHCMALREKAGGNPKLLDVHKFRNRKRIRGARKSDPARNNSPKKSGDVFAFINDSLSDGSFSKKRTESPIQSSLLKTSTCQALNVEELKMNERINKKNYELMILKEKLSRQKQNTVAHSTLLKQIRGVEGQLHDIQTNLKDLYKEKNYRKTMKELTEF